MFESSRTEPLDAAIAESIVSEPHIHSREFILLIAALISVVAVSIDALLPALGIITDEFAIVNRNHAQFVIGVFFIGMAVGQLIAGPLSDAFGRKPILYFGTTLYFIGSITCFLAPTFPFLLAGRLLQGFGVSGPYVSAVSIVRDRFSGREMAKVMSFVMMIFILVPALAPSIGQLILLGGSWRLLFLFYILYALGIGLWIHFRMEETLPASHRIKFQWLSLSDGFHQVIHNKTTIHYTLSIGVCFGSFFGYLNCSQQIFSYQFDSEKLFSVYFGVLALCLGVASLLNARIVERLGMRLVCRRAFSVIAVISLFFLSADLFTVVHLWMFLLYAGTLFFCFGLVFGNLNAIAMEPMGHIAGIASALIGSISSLLSLLLRTVIGQFYSGRLIPITMGFFIGALLSLYLMSRAADEV